MGDQYTSRPHCCRQVGLACDKCVRGTAGSIAALNENVASDAVFRLFRSIYSDPACAPMEPEFRKGYQEAVAERKEAREARLGMLVHNGVEQVRVQEAPAPIERKKPRRVGMISRAAVAIA